MSDPLTTPVFWSEGGDFAAAKLILTIDDAVLVYLRDDFDHIPYPAHWDLPGGGREGDETPEECALRELQEEFGLTLLPDRLESRTAFRSPLDPDLVSVFYTGRLSGTDIEDIRFGDEGQYWQFMPVREFIINPRAVPHFRKRVAVLLGDQII